MDENREPRWNKWRLMPEVEAWQAIALSLNIEPEKINTNSHAWMGANHPFDEGDEFNDRLSILLANLSNRTFFPTPCRLNMGAAYLCGVCLSEFASWGISIAQWNNLPNELVALASNSLGLTTNNQTDGFGVLMLKELKEQKAKEWVTAMKKVEGKPGKVASAVKDDIGEASQTNPNKSDRLAYLNQAANKFWANVDRNDRATHPDNKDVAAWLIDHGYSPTLADSAATIIRPEWAATGRKPEK